MHTGGSVLIIRLNYKNTKYTNTQIENMNSDSMLGFNCVKKYVFFMKKRKYIYILYIYGEI